MNFCFILCNIETPIVTKMDEMLLKYFQSVSKQETDPTMCYLQLNVIRCSNSIRLSLRFGVRFSTVVYVMDGESMQCVEVPCTANGKLPEDTMIFGNKITTSPPDLDFSIISTFTDKNECQTTGSNDEDSSVTVSCNEPTFVETQGQYYT